MFNNILTAPMGCVNRDSRAGRHRPWEKNEGGKSGWDWAPAAQGGRGRGEKPGQDAVGFSPGNSCTGRTRRPGSVTPVRFATVEKIG